MTKIYNFFDDAYYINLDYRTDRREKFETKTQKLGFTAQRFPAIQPALDEIPDSLKRELNSCKDKDTPYFEKYRRLKANEVGCCLSHKAIVKLAKDRNLNNVLIFEDDCDFLPDWDHKIQAVVNDLATVDWDVLYLGGELNNDAISITDNIALATGGVYCCHAYAVNRKFFDRIIDFDINWCYIIDTFLINVNHETRRYIVPKQLLAIQESNYSDLRGHNTNISREWMMTSWQKFIK